MVEGCAPNFDCLESVSNGDGAAGCYASSNEAAECRGHVGYFFLEGDRDRLEIYLGTRLSEYYRVCIDTGGSRRVEKRKKGGQVPKANVESFS